MFDIAVTCAFSLDIHFLKADLFGFEVFFHLSPICIAISIIQIKVVELLPNC